MGIVAGVVKSGDSLQQCSGFEQNRLSELITKLPIEVVMRYAEEGLRCVRLALAYCIRTFFRADACEGRSSGAERRWVAFHGPRHDDQDRRAG